MEISINQSGRQLNLQKKLFEQLSEGVILLDKSLHITWTNNAVEKISGHTSDTLLAEHISVLYTPEHTGDFYTNVWEIVDQTGFYSGIVWLSNPEKKAIFLKTNILSNRNDEDEIQTYCITITPAPQGITVSQSTQQNSLLDIITNVFKREHFEQRVDDQIEIFRDTKQPFALISLDIDRFKMVNEMYGRNSCDELLKQMSLRIRNFVPKGSIIGRVADDEFSFIVTDSSVLNNVDNFGIKLVDLVSRPYFVSALEIDVCVSVAIVIFGEDTNNKQTLYKRLDATMSISKLNWKSDYQVFSGSNRLHSFQSNLEDSLRDAILKNQFVLYYLPKIDTKAKKVVGVEALVRWQHPEMGLLSPAVFIPMAEESGLISVIGEMIFRMACTQLKKWSESDNPTIRDLAMSVNVSALEFRDEALGKTMISTMESLGIDPKRIEIDINENFAFEERSITSPILEELVSVGVSIALDDFGTGYSSISLLKKFPISALKIDRSFIKELPQNEDYKAIVTAIVAMTRSLNMKTIAEGVETIEQLEYLQSIECTEMQGYIIGRPMPADDVENLVMSYETDIDLEDVDFSELDFDDIDLDSLGLDNIKL